MIYKIELYVKKMCKQKQYILENLILQIFGDFGRSIELKPRKTNVNCSCDANSNVDVIHFHSHNLDLGNIFKVKLIQKNPSKNLLNWYLEKARVIHDKEEWTFQFQKWINMEKKEKKKEIKIFDDNYRKSRKDFFKDNKYSRTVSTLNHRLLTEDSINDDSYDDSFDNEHSRSPSNSTSRSPTNNQRRRSLSPDRNNNNNKSNDRERQRRNEPSRSDISSSGSSIEDKMVSSSRRRRSRSKSIERIPSPDLPSYKLESNKYKEKSPDYLDFKIEDKFEKRYANLPDRNDFRFKANNDFDSDQRNNFRRDDLIRDKIKIRNDNDYDDDDLEKRFLSLKSDPINSSYKKNTNYLGKISEDNEITNKNKYYGNDLKLDLNQTITKKTTKNSEKDNDKELNKIYESFFSQDKPISNNNNKKYNKSNENFKNSYLAEMNSFNLDNLSKSYKPTFY